MTVLSKYLRMLMLNLVLGDHLAYDNRLNGSCDGDLVFAKDGGNVVTLTVNCNC